ncbi:MAG: IscS subfamily cysteine desulfurase [Candidatus Eremiobacteraeota bacterium]|nr:IscS subfamily cysteine desulfurase [Candidatus Eremiobacteraeota bacterium]MBC5826881.1 IscS subfamily cysteine desulfurase [Candidatus Eremiobacteraeota bacterium]
MQRIYLDNAATTPVRPEVVEAMLPFFRQHFAHPSSAHASGQRVRRALDEARDTTAAALGADPSEIVFTAGGSESNSTAIAGLMNAYRARGNHFVTSATEHHAVLHAGDSLAAGGSEVTVLPVDSEGFVDADRLRSALTDKTVLVSIMHANNEIGTVARIAELAAVAHERGVLFHTDAVQTVGHLDVDVEALDVDALTLSAHKFGGPKGVGALYIRDGVRMQPIIHGGGQERGRRSGTENVPGIIGLSAALRLATARLPTSASRVSLLRDRLIDEILRRIPGSACNGPHTERLPNNASLRFAGVEGSAAIVALDLVGFEASTGSACASGSLAPSHVLTAIGLEAEAARSTVRFSLAETTQPEDIEQLLRALPGIVERLRAVCGALAAAR